MSVTRVLFAVAVTVFAAVVTNAQASSRCAVVATPCDNTFSSSQNQTFAFLGVGGPNVQLISYWGTQHACMSTKKQATNGQGANSTLSASYSTCSHTSSIWTYGPGSIKTYVYYNNTQNECLSLIATNGTFGANVTSFGVGMVPCCTAKNACTPLQQSAQRWLEADTTTDPYNRINSLLTTDAAPNAYCLTRAGDSC